MRSPELARGRSPPRWQSELVAFAGDDSPVQLQLRRAVPQMFRCTLRAMSDGAKYRSGLASVGALGQGEADGIRAAMFDEPVDLPIDRCRLTRLSFAKTRRQPGDRPYDTAATGTRRSARSVTPIGLQTRNDEPVRNLSDTDQSVRACTRPNMVGPRSGRFRRPSRRTA
jgi:hypothetical protein